MTPDDLRWSHEEGLTVAAIDQGDYLIQFVIEEDIHPSVEGWGWTLTMGWDLTYEKELPEQADLDASKQALLDWYNERS